MKKLLFWWKWEAKHLHRDFYIGIKNLIRWFPIIWKDRDWDDHYIWEILKTKLQNQAEYIGGNGHHVNAERDAERMMLCVRLIDKIQSEYYQSECMDYCIDEFHWDNIEDKPDYVQLRIEKISDNFQDYFDKYKLTYIDVMTRPKDKLIFGNDSNKRIAMNMAHINADRAQTLLFKILNKHITSWWD
jgi:hypothetical protein